MKVGEFRQTASRSPNQVRPDDVWVVTHPKCGTTWTQEMTWHIMTGVHLETTETKLFERSPFIDIAMIMDMKEEEVNSFFAKLDAMESPRLLKTHYPFELLPPSLLDTCKVVRTPHPPLSQGALRVPQCQGCVGLLLPPPESHEVHGPAQRLHQVCKV